jgi:ketosteroid isomerase-like protein
MTFQEPKDVVTGFLQDVDAGRAMEAFARMSTDIRFDLVAPPPAGGVYDLDGFIKFFTGTMAPAMAAPFRVKIIAMTVEGERVAVESESDCMNGKGFKYNNRYHSLFLVRDGKIVELREYLDSAMMLKFIDI